MVDDHNNRPGGRKPHWTPAEDDVLHTYYATHGAEYCSGALQAEGYSRTVSGVHDRARRQLKIKVDKKTLHEELFGAGRAAPAAPKRYAQPRYASVWAMAQGTEI